MNRSQRIAALDAVYAKLPRLECRGLCHDSCGPIFMTTLEGQRIRQRTGRNLTVSPAGPDRPGRWLVCSALTDDNRCAVYDIRPMICRLWGMTRALQCTYGCVPEGGFLSEREAYRLLAEAAEAAGDYVDADHLRVAADSPDLERVVMRSQAARLRRYGLTAGGM